MLKQSSDHTNKRITKILKNTADMALKRRARILLENLELKTGEKVLDVGCGDGFYLYLLSQLDLKLKLTGTDFDKTALKNAKPRLPKGIKLHYADLMRELPFKENTFDKIVMSEVAEHLPDDIKGLKQVFRVLKPGGILSISVPSKSYPLLWDPVNYFLEKTFDTHIKSGFWAGFWNQHIRLYSDKQLQKVLIKAGFEIEKTNIETFWCLPFNHYLINLVARVISNGTLSKDLENSLSKFKSAKKPWLIQIGFELINLIDKLNDLFPQKSGVSLVIKAQKSSR